MNLRTPCCLALALLASLSACAGDWPQFKRTPNRQGCDLAEQVALPSKLCCLIDFGSPIRASAAIVAGKAYAISGRGLLARVDLARNAVDWQVSLGGVNNESSPAVKDGKVYVGTTAGKFYVLDADSGRILKTYDAGAAILASPLLLENRVCFGSMNGTFHALDLEGNAKWTYAARNYIAHSAAAEDGLILFPDGSSTLYWMKDAGASGEVVRQYHDDPGHGGDFFSAPMIWKGGIYAGMVDQEQGGARRLARFDFATAKFDKNVMAGDVVVNSCISVDPEAAMLFFGTAYVGFHGKGAAEHWSTGNAGGADDPGMHSAPAVVGNCVIAGSARGEVLFLQKSKSGKTAGGAQLWSYKSPSRQPFDAPVAVSGGKVVVGSLDGCLYGFWDGAEVSKPVKVDPQAADRSSAGSTPAQPAKGAEPAGKK